MVVTCEDGGGVLAGAGMVQCSPAARLALDERSRGRPVVGCTQQPSKLLELAVAPDQWVAEGGRHRANMSNRD